MGDYEPGDPGSFDLISVFPFFEELSPIDLDHEQITVPSPKASATLEESPTSLSKNDDESLNQEPSKTTKAEIPTGVLKQWLEAHLDHPYPTKEEKASLREQSGLYSNQLTNWFANARRKHKASLVRSRHGSPTRSHPFPVPDAEDWFSMTPWIARDTRLQRKSLLQLPPFLII
jgi:hypothetical protein